MGSVLLGLGLVVWEVLGHGREILLLLLLELVLLCLYIWDLEGGRGDGRVTCWLF